MEKADIEEKCFRSLKETETYLVAKIKNGFLKQVTFEPDIEGPVKPNSLTTKEQKLIVLLETSPGIESTEKSRFLLVGSLEMTVYP